jgi:hypothetical protein
MVRPQDIEKDDKPSMKLYPEQEGFEFPMYRVVNLIVNGQLLIQVGVEKAIAGQ